MMGSMRQEVLCIFITRTLLFTSHVCFSQTKGRSRFGPVANPIVTAASKFAPVAKADIHPMGAMCFASIAKGRLPPHHAWKFAANANSESQPLAAQQFASLAGIRLPHPAVSTTVPAASAQQTQSRASWFASHVRNQHPCRK